MRIILSALVLTAVSLPSHAQVFGGDEPIKVLAEKATYEGDLTVLVGNVDVTQGVARIKSDRMNIYRSKANEETSGSLKLGAVNRIDARGNFRYTTPENNVTGDRGVYERGNTASTDKLVYNVNTETIRFSGKCQGSDCSGRPTITLNSGN